jgi:hypothetical protein
MKRRWVFGRIGLVVAYLVIGGVLFTIKTWESLQVKEDEGKVITFLCPNLEEEIRLAIGKPTGDIYQSELESERLIVFWAGYKDISDLTGLEYLTNVGALVLWGNQISDISPLSGLTNLILLDLAYNQISDISPLVANKGLSEGDWINLLGNPLSARSLNTYIPSLRERGVLVLCSLKE